MHELPPPSATARSHPAGHGLPTETRAVAGSRTIVWATGYQPSFDPWLDRRLRSTGAVESCHDGGVCTVPGSVRVGDAVPPAAKVELHRWGGPRRSRAGPPPPRPPRPAPHPNLRSDPFIGLADRSTTEQRVCGSDRRGGRTGSDAAPAARTSDMSVPNRDSPRRHRGPRTRDRATSS